MLTRCTHFGINRIAVLQCPDNSKNTRRTCKRLRGQIPVEPATGAIPDGIAAQAEQSCRNVAAVLAAAGVRMDRVIKTTCFLADMADFAAFNEVCARHFVSNPARSCVAVKALPKGVHCEIEAIAVKQA